TSDTRLPPVKRWTGMGAATAIRTTSFASLSSGRSRQARRWPDAVVLHHVTALGGRGRVDPALVTEGEVVGGGLDSRSRGVDRSGTRDLGFGDAAMRMR